MEAYESAFGVSAAVKLVDVLIRSTPPPRAEFFGISAPEVRISVCRACVVAHVHTSGYENPVPEGYRGCGSAIDELRDGWEHTEGFVEHGCEQREAVYIGVRRLVVCRCIVGKEDRDLFANSFLDVDMCTEKVHQRHKCQLWVFVPGEESTDEVVVKVFVAQKPFTIGTK